MVVLFAWFFVEVTNGQLLVRTAFDQKGLACAVNLWVTDEPAALALHGPISEWDTSRVKSMAHLFWGKDSFNADISM